MLFNSGQFLLFFPLVVLVNFILPKSFRWIWLLLSSYYFYMCWEPAYALLMLLSTVLTYLSGVAIHRVGPRGADGQFSPSQIRLRKLAVALSFVSNLSILVFFKYFDFLTENLCSALSVFGVALTKPSFSVLLPVGISFYTFQALSYTVDVYRGDVEVEKNFFRYALFVSFFPQLVAGPIERSSKLLLQLRQPKDFCFERMRRGLLTMLWGFVLKMVIADRTAIFVDTVYGDPGVYGGWYLVVATVLFAFQIYCDFAGYSTIAMGAAEILGINLMKNFNAPYLAQTVTDFWHRWHISLSTWFRDYLYIPLGGNRKGKLRKYFNLMTVFLVSGIWHGAAWSFVVWGGLNGLYQVLGETLRPVWRRIGNALGFGSGNRWTRLLKMLATFMLVDFAWIFFRAGGLRGPQGALGIINSIFHADNAHIFVDGSLYLCGLDAPNFALMLVSIVLLMLVDLCAEHGIDLRAGIIRLPAVIRCVFIAAAVLAVFLFGIWGSGYDAASFIYFQF